MELALVIYLIEVATGLKIIKDFGVALLVLSGIVFALITLFCFVENEQEEISHYLKLFKVKTGLILGFSFLLLSAFIPAKETAYTMLAAYGVTEIVKNEDVQRLGGKSLLMIEQALDDYLKTSEPPNKE